MCYSGGVGLKDESRLIRYMYSSKGWCYLVRKFSNKLGQFFKQLWEQTWLSEIVGFLSVGVVSIWEFFSEIAIEKVRASNLFMDNRLLALFVAFYWVGHFYI